MRLAVASALCAFGLVACTRSEVRIAPPPADSERLLKEIERETGVRAKANDVGYFESLLDERFAWIANEDHEVQTRSQFLEDLAKNLSFDVCESEDPVVTVTDTTAVVHGISHNKGRYKGEPFDTRYWYVDVFHWDGAGWKVLASASTRLKEPASAPPPSP